MFRNLGTVALGLSGHGNEVIEFALSNGFRGIDLDVVDFKQEADEVGLPKARRLIDSARLKLGTFQAPVDLDAEDAEFAAAMEKAAAFADLAGQLDCRRAVVTIQPASNHRPYHQNFEVHRRRISDLARLLEPRNIRLGVGFNAAAGAGAGRPFEFIRDADSLLLLLGMVQARNVGPVIDLWHFYACDKMATLDKLAGPQVVSLIASDVKQGSAPGHCGEESRMFPGESGLIDAAALLNRLAQHGYDGPVTPLAHPSRFAGMKRDAVARLAGQTLDAVWKQAGLSAAGKIVTSVK